MKPRTLALATFVALFGASASFGLSANDQKPIDETGPVTGATLDPADPATTPEELYQTDKSLAAEPLDDGLEPADSDEEADDDSDDDADDDDSIDDPTDDATAQAAAADSSEAAATDPTLSQTTAETTIPAALPGGAQQPRAPSDVARMDSDDNGTLEVGEIPEKSELKARFAEFDVDQDGSLSVTEFQSWLGPDHLTTGMAVAPAADASPADTAATTTTTTTDATAMSSDDDDPSLPDEEVGNEELNGEEGRPSDAGTPDVDSEEEEDGGDY